MRVLKRTEETLIIEEKPWSLGLLLGLFVIGLVYGAFQAAREEGMLTALFVLTLALSVCAIFSFASERVWLVLDRNTGTVELRRRNLLRYRREVFDLADLTPDGILVQSNDDTLRLALRLKSSEAPVPMTSYYQSGGNVRACAEAARDWLSGKPDRRR